jgi:hypothetical protein
MQLYESFDKDCLKNNQNCCLNKNMKSQIGVLNMSNHLLFPNIHVSFLSEHHQMDHPLIEQIYKHSKPKRNGKEYRNFNRILI